MSNKSNPLDNWSLDREIVLSRIYNAPRETVFEAWTRQEHLCSWFGPAGFTIESIQCDICVGGLWRFVMVAPDGTRFDNRMLFLEIKPPECLVIDHGCDKDNDPNRFRLTITFDKQGDEKTILTLRQLHPTIEQRESTIGFGAVEYGYQTLDKLSEHIEQQV